MINRGAHAADSIRLILPYGGGLFDQVSQLIQEPLAKAMGMPVVIDYVTGDGGKLGTRETIRSKPDSRTLLIYAPNVLAMWEFEGDKPLADLRPVAKLTRGMSLAIAVREDSALKDWQGMSTASKSSGLTMAISGPAAILLEMVKKRTHCCPVKKRTDSIGCRWRRHRSWDDWLKRPVARASSRKA